MTTAPNPPPKPPVLTELKDVVTMLEKLERNDSASWGTLQLNLNRAKRALRHVHGDALGREWLAIPEKRSPAFHATVRDRIERIRDAIAALERTNPTRRGKVFLGHGHSHQWRALRDFLRDILGLECCEFNMQSAAGRSTKEVLERMLAEASFAFLVLTAEEEHADETVHARPNVIHEVGLFQGHLGWAKAIPLLEDGCMPFSNIHGLTYISFPRNRIGAAFEEVRQVLEREGIIA